MADALTPGAIVWKERRTRPVTALFGVPAVILGVLALTGSPLVLQLGAGVAAIAMAALGVRAMRTALIESYTVTDREIQVAHADGAGVTVSLGEIERATLRGDRVQFDTARGPVTMGFVRHQRSLIRALEKVAPALPVERKLDAFCRT